MTVSGGWMTPTGERVPDPREITLAITRPARVVSSATRLGCGVNFSSTLLMVMSRFLVNAVRMAVEPATLGFDKAVREIVLSFDSTTRLVGCKE
jgi:hypothetical protein